MLVVADVAASSKWYQELLSLTSAHGGDQFEMLMGEQGLELMLHHVDFSEHPGIEDPREGTATPDAPSDADLVHRTAVGQVGVGLALVELSVDVQRHRRAPYDHREMVPSAIDQNRVGCKVDFTIDAEVQSKACTITTCQVQVVPPWRGSMLSMKMSFQKSQ